jgi:hypothetical protein
MKFNITLIVSCLVILIGTGCKKGKNDTPSDIITAVVDGTTWKSQYTTGYEHFGVNGFVVCTGFYGTKADDTTAVEIVIDDTAHIGLADSFHSSSVEYYKFSGSYGPGTVNKTHGTITVASWDKNAHRIAGTFSCVLYNTQNNIVDSVKIDNGQFNTSYRIN